MKDQKTVKQHFESIERSDIREGALKSMINDHDKCFRLSRAFEIGMKKWSDTPEGSEFWNQVRDHYAELEHPKDITPLPEPIEAN